jgi:hypothetical protein
MTTTATTAVTSDLTGSVPDMPDSEQTDNRTTRKSIMKQLAIKTSGAVTLAALLITSPAAANEILLSCDAIDNNDASLVVRYIHTPTRALFDASFKSAASTSFAAREELEVRVEGVIVGYVTLMQRNDGKIGASISFDSYANGGIQSGASIAPFPANWPGTLPPQLIGIDAGTRVMIGSLGCSLGA